jgi:type IV pilus assembly protein PilF
MNGTRAGVYAAVLACMLALSACASNSGVDPETAADANANLGADFLRKNDLNQAQTYFRKALSYDDQNFSANWGMAVVSQRLHQPDKARAYYKKALDLRAAPEVFNSYAVFLCRRGKTEQALAYFKRAAADPHYDGQADALANAGLCAQRAGHAKTASGYYQQALAANASQATALVNMAKLKYTQGHYFDARAFIERADAVTHLNAGQLLLAARIELALNNRQAAAAYLKRHNTSRPTAALSLSQLGESRS